VKRALLERGESTDEGTFGVLRLDGQTLRTTELPWRDNATGVSCIPPGVYRCELVNSPRFGRVYGVRDVPGRQNILIHAANFGGDKSQGWHTELLGCIAPAMSVGVLTNPNGVTQRAGLQSKAALAEFMAWAGGLPFELEIR
jgi:hypothetical protein